MCMYLLYIHTTVLPSLSRDAGGRAVMPALVSVRVKIEFCRIYKYHNLFPSPLPIVLEDAPLLETLESIPRAPLNVHRIRLRR